MTTKNNRKIIKELDESKCHQVWHESRKENISVNIALGIKALIKAYSEKRLFKERAIK